MQKISTYNTLQGGLHLCSTLAIRDTVAALQCRCMWRGRVLGQPLGIFLTKYFLNRSVLKY